MASAQKIDENGFMTVKSCPVSSFGIFDYSAAQLGLPGDPDRIVKVFRPEEAVSSPEALASFQNVPFIIDHEMLSGFEGDDSAEAPEDYGMDGVLTNVVYSAPWMRGDIKVFTRKAQQAIRSGKKELSLGYGCDFLETPGVWNGQPYEVVQTNMRGNHIALVDAARVSGARILDGLCFDSLSFTVHATKEKPMALSKKAKDNALAKLKTLLPELENLIGQMEGSGQAQASGSATGGEGAATDPNAAEATASNGATATGEEGDDSQNPNPMAGGEAGAEGTDPNAAPAGEGEMDAGGDCDMGQMLEEAEALIAKLKAANAGSPAGNGTDEDEEGTMGNGTDAVEGLQGEGSHAIGADESERAAIAQNGGKASPGPAAGVNATAGDAAIRSVYADLAAKDRIYKRLSPVVGAFDHAAMDARQVAAYGVKKLGLKGVPKGSEMLALDMHLGGLEKAKAANANAVRQGVAADSAGPAEVTSAFAAYLNG
ncbi:prohead core protein protease [Burkholderia phage vB_BglM_WTB]